jgi:mono/diheme cytochrome c family protein
MRFVRWLLAMIVLFNFTSQARATDGAEVNKSKLRERGRYVTVIAGCNDCHTPGYTESGGQTPESQWLTGTLLGWSGPWGTTYAANLRLYFQSMTADEWVQAARAMQARPPMPSYVFRTMSEVDLRSLYSFVASLGRAGKPAPSYAPPGQKVSTPVITFLAQPR